MVMVPGVKLQIDEMKAGPRVMASPGVQENQKRSSEHRRSNKPIMEKRRRARINNCLNELKTLILDAMKKDPARHSKLEKADILEMTVKHLESLRADPLAVDRFKAGFRECVTEVGRFPGLEPTLKRRLVQHLETCVSPRAKLLMSTSDSDESPQQSIFISTGPGSGVKLVPTRLANGDIALVLPAQNAASLEAMPTLVPIPSRTSSTASASSQSSEAQNRCYSPVSSNGWSSPGPEGESPLALVTRREGHEDKPWRPW